MKPSQDFIFSLHYQLALETQLLSVIIKKFSITWKIWGSGNTGLSFPKANRVSGAVLSHYRQMWKPPAQWRHLSCCSLKGPRLLTFLALPLWIFIFALVGSMLTLNPTAGDCLVLDLQVIESHITPAVPPDSCVSLFIVAISFSFTSRWHIWTSQTWNVDNIIPTMLNFHSRKPRMGSSLHTNLDINYQLQIGKKMGLMLNIFVQ